MKKILLVEDDKFLLKVYGKLLEKENFQTICMENGEKVLEVAKNEKPSLILLDIVMPVKDGYEVLKELKADSQTKDIPVLSLSVLKMREDTDKLRDLGVLKHIKKSETTFKDVLAEIKQVLGG